MKDITAWNAHYQTVTELPPPCQVLAKYTHLLPSQGTALDLACGLGANALLLARHGLETYAWDHATVALEHLQVQAQKEALPLHVAVRDVVTFPPPTSQFDVIVVSRFLERRLAPALIAALKLNGLLFYQTFTRAKVSDRGPKNPEYRLANNELLQLFSPPLQLVIYHEEGEIGDTQYGWRDEAWLIGKRI
jgi:SAM-dependent methyltransferase